MTNLQGKVALVTGAARRLGKAIALALADEGMHIMVHYGASAQAAEETVTAITAKGVTAHSVQVNLSKPQDIERMFEEVRGQFGRLDVLVNNAASFERGKFLDITLDDWERVMAINLRAPFLCSQHAARLMLEHGGGAIINMADLIGLRPRRTYVRHSVSKAGLVMLTKAMALALAPEIRVNAIAPGAILPPAELAAERWDELGAELPVERTGRPLNIQNAVLYLLKDDFITGQVVVLDGGESLLGPFGF